MTKAAFSIKELMDSGVHFGHRTMRWNAKMQPYIYGARNNIHIINLQKTAPLLDSALNTVKEVAENNGRILFVATKRQASAIVAESAERCGQYYVNHRWMGGTLTNWQTVSKSIKTLNNLEAKLADPEIQISKKERLQNQRQINKLNLALGGIRKMGGVPDLIFVIDTNREAIAIQEARKLGIPVVAIVDTNSDPDNIDYIVPGNDDSIKSIRLYCDLFSDAILSGMSKSLGEREEKVNKSEKKPAPKKEAKIVEKKVATKATPKKAEAEEKTTKAKKASPKKEESKTEAEVVDIKPKAKKEDKEATEKKKVATKK